MATSTRPALAISSGEEAAVKVEWGVNGSREALLEEETPTRRRT